MVFELWLPEYYTKCSQCPRWASTQDVVRLNNDCLISWKSPGVNKTIQSPFCIHCCKSWISLTAVAYRVTFRCHQK